MNLKIDREFQNLIPPLSKEEYFDLVEQILEHGQRDPIVIWNETILDGHNRYKILQEYPPYPEVPIKTVSMDFKTREEAKLWIIKNQFARRNLNALHKLLNEYKCHNEWYENNEKVLRIIDEYSEFRISVKQ